MDSSAARNWRVAGELLEQVLALPPSEQAASVETLGHAGGVLNELRALVESTSRASVLDEPLERVFGGITPEFPARGALSGREFGGWILEREIGRGGMSVVYLAKRLGEGYEQHAAFKLLSIAFFNQEHVLSFMRERKVLSALDHPGIARLIDGGVTPDGAPFLVMEYVDGQRIDAWCSQSAADERTVVQLVEQVCRAAAHAHRHLVVHRDINPANVLVDREGRAKLVDFGIAKLLGNNETGRTIQAFTPQYAAPEQSEGGAITTATDVYGLGKLLSHLLPANRKNRELESIIRVATHADVEQRYSSANEMGDDLQAWLENRPILARPDSMFYLSRKFAQRNWKWLGFALATVVVSVAGLVSTQQQTEISRLEAEKHRAVADFMLGLFEQADLMQAGSDMRVTDLLESAATQARAELEGEPEVLVSLLTLMASGQTELTNYAATADLLDEAEALIAKHEVSLVTRADYHLQRAKHAHELGRLSEAVVQSDMAVSLLKESAEHRQRYLSAAATKVSYLVDAEQYDQALALAESLLKDVSAFPAGLEAQVQLVHNYAIALEVSGDIKAAYEQYRKALELQRALQPDNALWRAAILSDYGIALYFDGRHVESEQAHREVLEIYTAQFSPPHPRISSCIHNLAFALVGQERLQEALELLQQAYDMSVALHGADHIDTLLEQATLGNILMRLRDFERAESLLRENLSSLERVAPEMRVQRGAVHSYLGDVLLQTGRLEEARVQYLTSREFFAELPEDNVRVVETRERLEEIAGLMQANQEIRAPDS